VIPLPRATGRRDEPRELAGSDTSDAARQGRGRRNAAAPTWCSPPVAKVRGPGRPGRHPRCSGGRDERRTRRRARQGCPGQDPGHPSPRHHVL